MRGPFRSLIPNRLRAPQDPIREIAAAGLFDLDYYAAQFPPGESAPADLRSAVDHYIATGRDRGLGFSALIEPEWWDTNAADPDMNDPVGREFWFISGQQHGSSTSPIVGEARAPFGSSREYVESILRGEPRADLPGGWSIDEVMRRLTEAVSAGIRRAPNDGVHSAVRWGDVQARLGGRIAGRVSLLIPTFQDWRMTVESARAAMEGAADDDIEVVIVDNGSRLAVFRSLAALFLAEERVKLIRCSANTNFAGGMNRAIAESTGEYVVFLNNDAVLEPGWREPLVAPLRRDAHIRGVQPLLMYPGSGRVQAAGTMFLGEGVLPWHFLAGHPREDAERMTDVRFQAVTAAVMSARAEDVVAAQGFDEEFENGYEDVDLCLRLRQGPDDHFVLARDAVAWHPEGSSPGRSAKDSANRVRFFARWAGRMPSPEPERYVDVNLRLTGLRPLWFADEVPILIVDPELTRRPRVAALASASGLPSLRWLLLAGDAPAAAVRATREALAELGQECVSVRGGVHWSDGLAEVVVAFDGAHATFPRAGAFNVLVGPESTDCPADMCADPTVQGLRGALEGALAAAALRYP